MLLILSDFLSWHITLYSDNLHRGSHQNASRFLDGNGWYCTSERRFVLFNMKTDFRCIDLLLFLVVLITDSISIQLCPYFRVGCYTDMFYMIYMLLSSCWLQYRYVLRDLYVPLFVLAAIQLCSTWSLCSSHRVGCYTDMFYMISMPLSSCWLLYRYVLRDLYAPLFVLAAIQICSR